MAYKISEIVFPCVNRAGFAVEVEGGVHFPTTANTSAGTAALPSPTFLASLARLISASLHLAASLSSFLPVPPPLLLPFPCRSRNNKLSLIPSRAGFPSSQVEVPLSIRALKVSSLSKSSSTAFHKGDSSLLTLPKEEASCQDFFKKVFFFFFFPHVFT